MQLFCETRRILRILSLYDSNANSIKSICHKIIKFFFVALMPMSTLSYLLFESKDSIEFFECSYVFTSSLTITGCFALLCWKERHLIEFITDLESIVTESNLKIHSEQFHSFELYEFLFAC